MPNHYELAVRAVDIYESQKVSSIFAPLAKVSLEKIEIADGDRVLDVACGTGIVARTIREYCGPNVKISSVDVNDMMLMKAQALTCNLPGQFDWYLSEAADIPVPSHSFTHVFCQQGLQYFPDDFAVLEEVRRVLSADGKLVLTVWEPANEYFLAQSAAMKKYVSDEAGDMALAPFSYPGEPRVRQLLARLGFKNVTVETVSIERVIPDAAVGIREDILGSPLGSMVEKLGLSVMEKIVQHILTACTEHLQKGNLVIAQKSTLITASTDQVHP